MRWISSTRRMYLSWQPYGPDAKREQNLRTSTMYLTCQLYDSLQERAMMRSARHHAVSSHGGTGRGESQCEFGGRALAASTLQTGIRRAFKPGGVSVVVVIVVVVVIIVIIFVWIIRSRASADQRRDTDLCRNATAAFTPGWPAHL